MGCRNLCTIFTIAADRTACENTNIHHVVCCTLNNLLSISHMQSAALLVNLLHAPYVPSCCSPADLTAEQGWTPLPNAHTWLSETGTPGRC